MKSHPPPPLPPTPLFFKVWAAVAVLLALALLGLTFWAVITLVNHHTT